MIRVLERLIEMYGKPEALRVDNGPQFTAVVFAEWCRQHGIALLYIEPGKPDQNASRSWSEIPNIPQPSARQ